MKNRKWTDDLFAISLYQRVKKCFYGHSGNEGKRVLLLRAYALVVVSEIYEGVVFDGGLQIGKLFRCATTALKKGEIVIQERVAISWMFGAELGSAFLLWFGGIES